MRIKTRVRSAMASQAAIEGRFLGGRPPYGYQLVDAGPHPNPGKAAIGQRLRRSAPDPIAAPVVQRIFERVRGRPRPPPDRRRVSTATASRPRRRTTRPATATGPAGSGKWAKSAIRAILGNPRYTGFEVWNKQRKDEVLIDVDDVALGHRPRCAGTTTAEWIWSAEPTHEAARQPRAVRRRPGDVRPQQAARRPAHGRRGPALPARRARALRRLRPADAGPVEPRPRLLPLQVHRATTPTATVRAPEERLREGGGAPPRPRRWLGSLFDDEHIDDTCAVLAGASEPDPAGRRTRGRASRRQSRTATTSSRDYRSLLDAGRRRGHRRGVDHRDPDASASTRGAARPAHPGRQDDRRTGQGTRHRAAATSSPCSPTPSPSERPSSTTSSASL